MSILQRVKITTDGGALILTDGEGRMIARKEGEELDMVRDGKVIARFVSATINVEVIDVEAFAAELAAMAEGEGE